MTRAKLEVDPARVRALETAVSDFRRSVDGMATRRFSLMRIEQQFRSFYLAGAPQWRTRVRRSDPRARMTPDFASVGSIRSGTSTLAQYILQHPCVALPLAKEAPWGRSELLRAYMPTRAEGRVIERRFGFSITGLCNPALPSMMYLHVLRAINPAMRVIVCIRNPIDRAFSHWRHDRWFVERGSSDYIERFSADFDAIVAQEMASIPSGGQGYDTWTGMGFGYLQLGIYLPWLKLLHEVFDARQIRVVRAEDLFAAPRPVVAGIQDFLDLPRVDPVEVREQNAGPPGRINTETRVKLRAFFAPYNAALEDFVDRRLEWA